MVLRTYCLVFLVAALAGCGPAVSPGDLPALPPVATEPFLDTVADQLDDLRAAVEQSPLSPKNNGHLGMAYLAYRQDDAAEVALRRARLLQPRKFEWIYYHAEALTRLGRLGEAAEALEEAVTRKSGYTPARIRLGQLHVQLGDLETARSYLNSVVEDKPANAAARLALARLHLRADEADEARSHLDDLIERNGPSGSAYFALAEAWRRSGDRAKAAEYLALSEKYRAVVLPADDPLMRELQKLDQSEKPFLRMATQLNQLGKAEEAMEMLHRALARNPKSDLTHAALVGAYGKLKQFDKVDEHYRLALEAAPPTAPLLRNLGRARFYEKRIAEAQQALEQALELNPHDASALAWLGVVHLHQDDIETGLGLLAEALEQNPREAMARHNMANTLYKLGRHEEALVHMKELVVVEDQHSPRVWRQMGESYLALGQTAQAREALTAAVASAKRLDDGPEAKRSANLLQSIAE